MVVVAGCSGREEVLTGDFRLRLRFRKPEPGCPEIMLGGFTGAGQMPSYLGWVWFGALPVRQIYSGQRHHVIRSKRVWRWVFWGGALLLGQAALFHEHGAR